MGRKSNNSRPFLYLILTVCLLVSIPALGAEEGTGKETDTIRLDASEYVKSDREQIVAVGDVEIKYKEYTIMGPRVVIFRQDEVVLLEEGVTFYSEGFELKARWGQFFIQEDRFRARGDVYLKHILAKESEEEPLELQADEIELTGKPVILTGKGNIYITYKDYRLWGDEFEYREEEELLVLKGDAIAEQNNGNKIKAREIIFDLADDSIEARNGVEIEFILED